MNTFQKLVKLIETDKSVRKYLVQKLNYKDMSSGTNKLLNQLRNNSVHVDRLKIICELLDYYNAKEIIDDYIKTKESINKEQNLLEQISWLKQQIKLRDEFKPYIYIITEHHKPESLSIASLIGNKTKYIKNLPENISDLSKDNQLEIIKDIITEHYDNSKCICLLYGNITGYIFYRSFNEKNHFSIKGEPVTNTPDLAVK